MSDRVNSGGGIEKVGVVVSTKMEKTVVVLVTSFSSHPLYKKKVASSKRFYAHCEDSNLQDGDTVRIVSCRPYSKLKRWKVVPVNSR